MLLLIMHHAASIAVFTSRKITFCMKVDRLGCSRKLNWLLANSVV